MNYKIYVVEDDTDIAEQLLNNLEKYGYECQSVTNFSHVFEEFQAFEPHIVIMDINLPAFDGYFWSRKIRSVSNCPIMIVSARMSELDQVYGIENGADDFITKPFLIDVVLAKVNSQIRRVYGEYANNQIASEIERGNTILNPNTVRLITRTGKEEFLSVKELQLCKLLFEAYPNALPRQQLIAALWDDESFVEENTLSVNIARLRKKLLSIGSNLHIQTIRGMGYQLVLMENTL